MTMHGHIKSYDSTKGVGTITPEEGGEALAFVKAELREEGLEPKKGQRYSYEIKQLDGGKTCGVNLQMQRGGILQSGKQPA